jgi:NAD(P)-dependent dehydrogenase (short-subunit alcohol dehydrogenase family)
MLGASSPWFCWNRQVTLVGTPRLVKLELDDLQSERHFQPMQAYGRSKLAMVMCGYVLACRLEGTGVTVNALHPGLVNTDIVDEAAPTSSRKAPPALRRRPLIRARPACR